MDEAEEVIEAAKAIVLAGGHDLEPSHLHYLHGPLLFPTEEFEASLTAHGDTQIITTLGGNDTITGDEEGTDNDIFVFGGGGGNDTITDFNFGNTGSLDDGDSTNNDFIDLSGHCDHLSELYADQADDGILNQSNATDTRGRSTDYSDNNQFSGGSIEVQGAVRVKQASRRKIPVWSALPPAR